MIFDTNILIKLEREIRRHEQGPVTTFLEKLPATRMCISPTIAGEFASGLTMAKQEKWQAFLSPYELLPITVETSWHYGQIYRALAKKGTLIGTNDLWIAATALTHRLPLLTHNVKEFSRVNGLELIKS